MTRRRDAVRQLAGGSTAAALALVISACAPLAGVRGSARARLGYLSTSTGIPPELQLALHSGLRDHGWVDGENLEIAFRHSHGDDGEILTALAGELVRWPAQVVFTSVVPCILAVQRLNTSMPIVTTIAADPVALGFAASFAHPGGQITGVSAVASPVAAKRIEIFRQIVPSITHLAVLVNLGNPGNQQQLDGTNLGARSAGWSVLPVDVRGPGDFDSAFETVLQSRAEALVVLLDASTTNARERIVEFARQHRIPTMYGARTSPEAGGLMSFGTSTADHWRRAGSHIDRILRGARPGDLPFEQPTTFELVVNREQLTDLGLTVPPDIAVQVTEWL